MRVIAPIFGMLLLVSAARANLASIKEEPNAEKRADRAMDYGGKMLLEVREKFAKHEMKQLEIALAEFRGAIELTVDSLKATGKEPAKNPRAHKKVELRLREFMRKLKTMEHDLDFDDRALIKPVIDRVEQIQDDLVQGIFSKK